MLGQSEIWPAIAVSDIEAAKAFYGGTLGLKQVDESQVGVTYESGGCKVLVYPSEFAGTNKATYAGWVVNDVDGVVADLKIKGVNFMTFNVEGAMWNGDVASWGDMKAAWFTDPDGNILSLGNM